MALKYLIPGIVLFLTSACTSGHYDLQVKFDPDRRISTLYLISNNEKTDSITGIGSYYGEDSLVSVGNYWDYKYKGRCGTGCSITYYMRLKVIDDQLKPMLNILYSYTEEDDSSGERFSKQYIPHFSDSQNYILTKAGGVKTNLKYSKEENIYYNEIYKIDGNDCKGIHVDTQDYVYTGKKWKFYNPGTGVLDDLR